MDIVDKKVYRVFNSEDLVDHEAITGVIRRNDDKYLVMFHKKYNFWTFPIGKVKNGQTPETALVEEILEECNLDVLDFDKIITFKNKYERNSTMVEITNHVFMVNDFSGECKNMEPKKHDNLQWMSLNNLKNLEVGDATRLYLALNKKILL